MRDVVARERERKSETRRGGSSLAGSFRMSEDEGEIYRTGGSDWEGKIVFGSCYEYVANDGGEDYSSAYICVL